MLLAFSIIIISIAFFGESIFGMGGGFISIPLLTIILGPKIGVTLVLVFQLLMGFLIFHTYKYIHWKVVIPMTISIIIGTIIGTYTLSLVSDIFLKKFLAITIFIFLGKMIFFPKITFKKKHEKMWGFFTGAVGGLFQGMTGTSSPIFAMYLTSFNLNKSTLRATFIYIFFATSVVRVIISFSRGLFTKEVLSLVLPAIPFFLLAIFLGHHVHKKINEKYYRYTVYAILFFSAILLLFRR